MSYNCARLVNPDVALCSFSSASAGNVAFSFLNGGFTLSISTTTITLEAGFEYFITSAPTITLATTYYHIVNGTNGDSYSVGATSTDSGLDEQSSSIQADTQATFSLYASQAVTSNSRLIIWRIPL